MTIVHRICLIPLLLLTGMSALAAKGEDAAWMPTPPRLGFIDGEEWHWRQGAQDWARAQPNLALAEGDALSSGSDARFEVQYGSRGFVRADADTRLSRVAQGEHRIRFALTRGRVSFKIRSMAAGDTLELSTPDAVFTVEHPGCYRVEVSRRDSRFITRHGGAATVTLADGRVLSIPPSGNVVVSAGDPVRVASHPAPAPDSWDFWNDARSGESISSHYLPPGVYGTKELDRRGRGRVVPRFGPVWIPGGVGADWVPYSTGSWVRDPYYEWTWIDDAPWGWAPFHYGRWIDLGGLWAWASGPMVGQPADAPALVAFIGGDREVSVRVGVGRPPLGWVALRWGEPLLPWWGPPRHRGHPGWGGWGRPRVVDKVVIEPSTVTDTRDLQFQTPRPPPGLVARPGVSTPIPRQREPAVRGQDDAIRSRDVDRSRYLVAPRRHRPGTRTLPGSTRSQAAAREPETRPPSAGHASPRREAPPVRQLDRGPDRPFRGAR